MIPCFEAIASSLPPTRPVKEGWNWAEVFRVYVEGGSLRVHVGPWGWIAGCLLLVLVLVVALIIMRNRRGLLRNLEAVEGEIPIPGLGKVTVKPNHDTVTIAYKAWVELATRKAAIPFDEDHDVISEVYDSWYALFGELRELAKGVPAQLLRRDAETKNLVGVMIAVLNDGLRPHLTRWQARFRKWYEKAKEGYSEDAPQDIQKRFESYPDLVADLKKVNRALGMYAKWLRRIAEGDAKLVEGPRDG